MSVEDMVQITTSIPLLIATVLTLFLIGFVVGGAVVYVRRSTRVKRLSGEAQRLQSRIKELTQLVAQLSDAREPYRHFVYNVSHEVANPLQSIQTNLENMTSCAPDEAGRRNQYHQTIAAEVQRLTRLTENLRLLSRLEMPDAPIVREPVNIKAVIEDVIMSMSEAAEGRRVRLRYVGPQRPARVMGDRDCLYQVLMNLVDNGIKYSKSAGGEVVISVSEAQDRLWIRGADDGIGIDKIDLAHVFDTAYRARDARSFRRGGSGLGLAIAKQIVEQHGGTLSIDSEMGEGTVFTFDLPLYTPSAHHETKESRSKTATKQ